VTGLLHLEPHQEAWHWSGVCDFESGFAEQRGQEGSMQQYGKHGGT
jgi:hypothetical protein